MSSTCRSARAVAYLGDTSGFVGGLVGGWSVNGVTTLQAGLPLAFLATPNLVGFGYGLRPNVVDGCDKSVSGSEEERLNEWFNTACYTVPNAAFVAADPASDPRLRWALGNAERVDPDLRAHGVHNWNFAVSKQTRLAGQGQPDPARRGVQPVQPGAVRPAQHHGEHRPRQRTSAR